MKRCILSGIDWIRSMKISSAVSLPILSCYWITNGERCCPVDGPVVNLPVRILLRVMRRTGCVSRLCALHRLVFVRFHV